MLKGLIGSLMKWLEHRPVPKSEIPLTTQGKELEKSTQTSTQKEPEGPVVPNLLKYKEKYRFFYRDTPNSDWIETNDAGLFTVQAMSQMVGSPHHKAETTVRVSPPGRVARTRFLIDGRKWDATSQPQSNPWYNRPPQAMRYSDDYEDDWQAYYGMGV